VYCQLRTIFKYKEHKFISC